MTKKKIIWFTGLSGVGKTTLSDMLIKKLSKSKYKILKIDGDIFRRKIKLKSSFTKKNIIYNNLKIISYIKKKFTKFDYTIVSVISPLKLTRNKAQSIFKDNYYEIYLYCPLKELIKRDTKGLYLMAKQKKIKNLIGFNSNINYEISSHKKIKINTKITNKKKALQKILNKIDKKRIKKVSK